MPRLNENTIEQITKLRKLGKTYGEICTTLSQNISKSTLHYHCHSINLTKSQKIRIEKINNNNLINARRIAKKSNYIKQKLFLHSIKKVNQNISQLIQDENTAKIALSMLCLGEASKYKIGRPSTFSLGSSDPRIIKIFISLLKKCYEFDPKKMRFTIQCRADQNTLRLRNFWNKVVNMPEVRFYKTRIDNRTIGKPTMKKTYMGVLRIDYFNTKVQLDLESLAHEVYNRL